ncbi:alanine dehydrogenase [Gelidibacter maritimus]|uniref:Alanine dehydrogenase n=1 Tax=Gelidibacter maritimus TaxID=2761487 RepID=A0A7W2R4Z1_9FLAO|nr:alanine dehydrogenase [Gelidibacter maritimus]MBA6154406.1 alanine dehydrogenase [Gelidibacter maritimus]
MIIGIPKEVKADENRVAIQPSGVLEMKRNGHEVLIQKGAGVGSGFVDQLYIDAGATILDNVNELWKRAEMIMKVKEPIPQEYPLMREGQIVFTFFHFAANEALTKAVLDSKCVAIAYETVEEENGNLPLLVPMSEVAGRMAAQKGAVYLEKTKGGRGVLMGGITGVKPARVLVLGGGNVGVNAAKVAAGMGANTTIMHTTISRLSYLNDVLPKNINTLFSNPANIRAMLPVVDLIIGAALIPGAEAPKLITRDMLKEMRPGTVMVDVSIDQGGCFETSRPTTHEDPVFVVDGVTHYCVTNMPGAVPQTATVGLTNTTLNYAIEIANKGWKQALKEDKELQKGLNIANGTIVYQQVAEAFNMAWEPIDSVLN